MRHLARVQVCKTIRVLDISAGPCYIVHQCLDLCGFLFDRRYLTGLCLFYLEKPEPPSAPHRN